LVEEKKKLNFASVINGRQRDQQQRRGKRRRMVEKSQSKIEQRAHAFLNDLI
jgi:hypothetical protein